VLKIKKIASICKEGLEKSKKYNIIKEKGDKKLW
jgi:hypothetical protein